MSNSATFVQGNVLFHKEWGMVNGDRKVVFSLTCRSPELFGRGGVCACCRTNKSTIVNDVCLECASPERKHKHR